LITLKRLLKVQKNVVNVAGNARDFHSVTG